jgi:hypothetical protein
MIKNKGTNAGGAKTNHNGLAFEAKTCIENKLLENKFNKIIMNPKTKNDYYFEIEYDNIKIIYLTKHGFKLYCKINFNIDSYKEPDEAFIIYYKNKNIIDIKILEKKNQNMEGSVEDKLKTGDFTKKEYQKIFNKTKYDYTFIISYAFCVSKFLQNKLESNYKKYINLKEILADDGTKIFYGEDENYFDLIYNWIITI